MRRGSVVAPLLLILIGVLFLVNNLRPNLSLLELVGRYWPFLLVGWGALRLLEILILSAKSRPLPTSGISGGEWALVVVIALVGSSLLVVGRINERLTGVSSAIRGLEVFGENYDYPVSVEQKVGSTPRVIVENLRGNARIVGVDTDEVRVTGRKTIRAMQQERADRANEQSPVEINVNGDQVVIRTNQERVLGQERISADIDITVPRGASVEARGRYGDFDISDLSGSVDVVSDSAGVRLENIGGNVRIDLRRSDIIRATNLRGNLDLKGNGKDVELENIAGLVTVSGGYSGEFQVRNLAQPLRYESNSTELRVTRIPGELRMALGHLSAERVVGPMKLTSNRSKDIEISDFSDALEIVLDRGDIQLSPGKGPLGKVDVRTRSGNIDLALLPDSRFTLTASTNRGSVQNEYGEPIQEDIRGQGGVLSGKSGAGPEMRLATERGTIRVRKAGIGRPAMEDKAFTPNPPRPPVPIRPQTVVQ